MCLQSEDVPAPARAVAAAVVAAAAAAVATSDAKADALEEHRSRYRVVLDQLIAAVRDRCDDSLPPIKAQLRRSDTVFLFDWDDTIHPTTYLEQYGFMETPGFRGPSRCPDLPAQLALLDNTVADVLSRAATHGRVVIVTNAGEGWVQLSAQRYLPRVDTFIKRNRIRVVSARGRYFNAFPDAPCEWKVHAFGDELRGALENNILVLGDSLSDQYAAHRAVEKAAHENVLLKFVKFAERPSLEQLRKQLAVTRDNIEQIVLHKESFDVNVVPC